MVMSQFMTKLCGICTKRIPNQPVHLPSLVSFGYMQVHVHVASLIPHLLIDLIARTMIRLTGLPNWSESSLAKYVILWFSYDVTRMTLRN